MFINLGRSHITLLLSGPYHAISIGLLAERLKSTEQPKLQGEVMPSYLKVIEKAVNPRPLERYSSVVDFMNELRLARYKCDAEQLNKGTDHLKQLSLTLQNLQNPKHTLPRHSSLKT